MGEDRKEDFRDNPQRESDGELSSSPPRRIVQTGVDASNTKVSALTNASSMERVSWSAGEAKMEESVSKRTRVTTQDVANIFRASTTTAPVTQEEVSRVKMMHDKISSGAEFSFDYAAQLIIAVVIAGLGLVSNSGTTVISSMLISPIMGPVIGMAYGASVCDFKLVWRSLRIECLSLLLCVLFGAVIAVCTGWTELGEGWATDQMYSRGTVQNLLVGLPVAFFSGLGVALAVLDDQTSSLVGVAISASLLPPAVNTGLLFVYSGMLKSGRLHEREEEEDENFVQMGLISFGLTVSNIILVIISSMLMFRIKEELPIRKSIFWHDLKTARRIYQRRALVSQTNQNSNEDLVIETVPEEAGSPLGTGLTESGSFDQF